MVRYEHLPIYKTAMDWAMYLKQMVRNFSRYHKYTLGSDLRQPRSGTDLHTSPHMKGGSSTHRSGSPSPFTSFLREGFLNRYTVLGEQEDNSGLRAARSRQQRINFPHCP